MSFKKKLGREKFRRLNGLVNKELWNQEASVVVVSVVAGDDVGRVDEGVKATVVGDFLLF